MDHRAPNPRADRLKALALELAVLAGHLVLYPSGMVTERHRLPPGPDTSPRTAGSAPDTPDTPHTPDTRGNGQISPDPRDNGGISPDSGPRPVVLLHGFVDNRSVFVVLRRSLARAGRGRDRVESLAYSPLTCDLRTAAELLARQVTDLLARSGHTEVDLVGHSLGGLIARYYVQRLGGDTRVRTLVMLGTPHAGTTFGSLADAHPLVRQMRPGSEVLRELARPAPGCRTRFVSLWSDLDEVMVPVETARLDHPDLVVRNVRVGGIGHLALPVHPSVAAEVLRALADGEADPASGPGPGTGPGPETGPGTGTPDGASDAPPDEDASAA
jgi:hypothetical protein